MEESRRKIVLLFFLISFLFFALLVKIFYIQVLKGKYFKTLAEKQQSSVVKISSHRGRIFDSQGNILALSIPSFSLYAQPLKIKNPVKTARLLSEILDMQTEKISDLITQKKKFVWIKRKCGLEVKRKIEKLKMEGVGFIEEDKRFYPQKKLASHLLGFVGIDNKGLEGLEAFYDDYLRPKPGQAVSLKDSRGRILPIYKVFIPARDGFDLILNVDIHIQYWAEFYLKEAILNTKAKGGSVVVLNPQNGRVLALANFPDFDPQLASTYSWEVLHNRAVWDFYEPGSVFKIVTLIATLAEDEEVVNKKFYCHQGAFKIPGSILHDWKKFGELSYEEVFKNSSNIGVAKLAGSLDEKVFYSYIRKLGFGSPTGIDLNGETEGYVKPPSLWSKSSRFIIPIGHEVCVSILQLARAYALVANGGYLVRPFLVDKIVDKNKVVIKKLKPRKRRVSISSEVFRKARQILKKVVEEGTGRRARIEGVEVAGKTGTAQKVSPEGRYSSSRYYASFVGFFPVESPQYLIAVVIDEPRTYHYGGMVAAPVFKKIGEKIIEYKGLSVIK